MGVNMSVAEVEYKHLLDSNDLHAVMATLAKNRKLISVKSSRPTGDKALHLAARHGDGDIIRGMAECIRASAIRRSKRGTSPNRHVVTHRMKRTKDDADSKVVKAVNQRNNIGQTPIMLACEEGSLAAVSVLLELGADPWACDAVARRTCIHYAAGTGRVEIIKFVVQYIQTHPTLDHARVLGVHHTSLVHDIPAGSGLTPLHYATWHRQQDMIRLLVSLGASLYSRSRAMGTDPECRSCFEGSTPLHLAALKGSLSTVKSLLKAYVALRAEQQQQEQEQQQQQQEQHVEGVQPRPPQQPNLMLMLMRQQQLEALPDPRTMPDLRGHTPFAIARAKGHFRLLFALNPLSSLVEVLAEDDPADRVIGVPRLQELAAKAAHDILTKQICLLAEQIKEEKQRTAATRLSASPARQAQQAAAAATPRGAAVAAALPPQQQQQQQQHGTRGPWSAAAATTPRGAGAALSLSPQQQQQQQQQHGTRGQWAAAASATTPRRAGAALSLSPLLAATAAVPCPSSNPSGRGLAARGTPFLEARNLQGRQASPSASPLGRGLPTRHTPFWETTQMKTLPQGRPKALSGRSSSGPLQAAPSSSPPDLRSHQIQLWHHAAGRPTPSPRSLLPRMSAKSPGGLLEVPGRPHTPHVDRGASLHVKRDASLHGSSLAAAALLLAQMPPTPRRRSKDVQHKSHTVHGGHAFQPCSLEQPASSQSMWGGVSYTCQHVADTCSCPMAASVGCNRMEQRDPAGVACQAGAAGAAASSFSGPVSLRSSSAFNRLALSIPCGSADLSSYEQLQLEGQCLADTLDIARTHRLLHGVGHADHAQQSSIQPSPLAMMSSPMLSRPAIVALPDASRQEGDPDAGAAACPLYRSSSLPLSHAAMQHGKLLLQAAACSVESLESHVQQERAEPCGDGPPLHAEVDFQEPLGNAYARVHAGAAAAAALSSNRSAAASSIGMVLPNAAELPGSAARAVDTSSRAEDEQHGGSIGEAAAEGKACSSSMDVAAMQHHVGIPGSGSTEKEQRGGSIGEAAEGQACSSSVEVAALERSVGVPGSNSAPMQHSGSSSSSGGEALVELHQSSPGGAACCYVAEPPVDPTGGSMLAAAESEEEEEEEEEDICAVCLDTGDFLEVSKCRHLICVDCASELIRLHMFKPACCPMCRGLICGFRRPCIP